MSSTVAQPPLLPQSGRELFVAIGSLALGGAERIVLDWAARVRPAWSVHLLVLRDQRHEWPVPSFVRTTRLGGVNLRSELERLGSCIARSAAPVCVCHLLTRPERAALEAGGAFVVPVVHNAPAGWLETAGDLAGKPVVIAVSDATAAELRRRGCDADISVIRHITPRRTFADDARIRWRRSWRVPEQATVIGMIGAVKPQKNYPFAVRLLRAVLERRDVYLVIVGGPIGRNGRDAWLAVLDEMRQSGVRHRLSMPGFVADAAACLPAFDLLLNTSGYEGLSIATTDALVNGVPVVASAVGGQGELHSDALTLVAPDAPIHQWADAVVNGLGRKVSPPDWAGFPSHRLWTLASLARPFCPTDRLLFVTANLNAGGAQRSLVNLARAWRPRARFEIAVTGDSTADHFFNELRASDVSVHRTAASRDAFDHAEVLVEKICREAIGTVCFWNLDPKIKLLLAKALHFTEVKLVDVSPGESSFDEMRAAAGFARLIAFSEAEFYERLDRLVLKFHGRTPAGYRKQVEVIPNGVPAPAGAKSAYAIDGPARIVVNGRIAPTKFIVEIVVAMATVRSALPGAELHVFGAAEPRHHDYLEGLARLAGDGAATGVFLHGAAADTPARLHEFDAAVVLGADQGCPNALLEALAAGLPCVANDDGGTKELVINERTGLLVPDRTPATIAAAVLRLLGDRQLAEHLGRAGRAHVLASVTMASMASRYESLFNSLTSPVDKEMTA